MRGYSRKGAPYRTAWQRYQRDLDLHALIAAVAGRHATDPAYGRLVAAIAGQTNIAQAIAAARHPSMPSPWLFLHYIKLVLACALLLAGVGLAVLAILLLHAAF